MPTRRLIALPALIAAAALASATPAAASTSAVYGLSGTATMYGSPIGCVDCLPASSTASGSASCSVCFPPGPVFGSFTLDLPTITTFPPSPCRVKTISGTLTISWDSGLVSTASVSGRFIDDKSILNLDGSFDTNDPVFPGDPLTIVLDNYPPSPCTTATNPVSGALTISTG
jgi:hypothetical protein